MLYILLLCLLYAEGKDVCFLSFGCWGGAPEAKGRQAQVAHIMGDVAAKKEVKFVLGAGDNFYKKGVKSIDDPRFEETFERVYSHESLRRTRFYMALGNHDYRGNFLAQVNYTKHSSRWYMPATYYSEVIADGQILLVVVDTPLLERCHNNGHGSPRCWDEGRQIGWLRKALEDGAHIPWKIVVGHYPMYANGPHINHPWLRRSLEPLFEQFHVTMYINADNHYVQVCKKGNTYYVNSGGGAGYLPHKKQDKGYSPDAYSIFLHLGDGPVLHCLTEGGTELHSEVVSAQGVSLFQWNVKLSKDHRAQRVVEEETSFPIHVSRIEESSKFRPKFPVTSFVTPEEGRGNTVDPPVSNSQSLQYWDLKYLGIPAIVVCIVVATKGRGRGMRRR